MRGSLKMYVGFWAASPRSLALGNSSNVWVVPATETAVYLNVDFTVGNAKDTNAGLINIHRVDSGGTVLGTHTVFDEYDSGVLDGVTGGSRLWIGEVASLRQRHPSDAVDLSEPPRAPRRSKLNGKPKPNAAL